MAYIDETVFNDFQSQKNNDERFISEYGVNDLVSASGSAQDYIDPETMNTLKTISSNRGFQIPYLVEDEITVTQTPGFTIPQNLGESAKYSFVAYDVFSGFRHYPSSFGNNNINSQFYVEKRIDAILQKKAEKIEEILISTLDSRKTQVLDYTTQISQGEGTYTFNGATDTLEISKAAQKDTMFYNLTELMRDNKLKGQYKIVTSPGGLVANDVEALKYRMSNDKQIDWAQAFMPNTNRYMSHQITPGADNFNGWLVRDGDIGVIENHPYDFTNRTVVGDKKWSVSDVKMKYTNMRANIWMNKDATDNSSIVAPGGDSNGIMSAFQEVAMWTRFYVFYRPNSDLSTRQQGIVKLKGLTT